jgi:hypothetical protein
MMIHHRNFAIVRSSFYKKKEKERSSHQAYILQYKTSQTTIEVFDTPETLFNNKNKTENNMEPLFSDKDAIVGVIFFTKQQKTATGRTQLLPQITYCKTTKTIVH